MIDLHPPNDQPVDFRAWVAKPLAEVVTDLFRKEIELRILTKISRRSGEVATMHVSPGFTEILLNSWTTYDARTEGVADKPCRSYHYEVQRHFGGEILFDRFPHPWLANAVRPLVQALENGAVGIAGQREPVKTRDQATEEIPFHALDDRLWRLLREKSRLEILSLHGSVEARFRRVHLILPVTSDQPLQAASMLGSPGNPNTEVKKALLIEAFRLVVLQEPNLQDTGSQQLARRLRECHPELKLSLREMVKLIDECRGGSFPPGRPKGRKILDTK